MSGIRERTGCDWSMVGVHDESDALSYAVDGGMMVEVEVGSRWCTGCSGRLKRGSGIQHNIGEGRLLVVDDQT